MIVPYYAIISCPGMQVRLSGSAEQGLPDDLGITKDGVEGWLSSPDLKVQLVQRANGNGAHDIPDTGILYAERVVTIHWVALADTRPQILAAAAKLSSLCGRTVRIRVVDGMSDTYATGYVRPQMDAAWHEGKLTGTLTITCVRPERLSTLVRTTQLFAVSTVAGGLSYGPAGKGLYYGPGNKGLQYGVSSGDGQRNLGLLVNQGTSPAYPLITVTGRFNGLLLMMGDGSALQYDGQVGDTPLILDSRSGAAWMGGVDVGGRLSRRGFPIIQANGSLSIRLMAQGTGWATCESQDTYI